MLISINHMTPYHFWVVFQNLIRPKVSVIIFPTILIKSIIIEPKLLFISIYHNDTKSLLDCFSESHKTKSQRLIIFPTILIKSIIIEPKLLYISIYRMTPNHFWVVFSESHKTKSQRHHFSNNFDRVNNN